MIINHSQIGFIKPKKNKLQIIYPLQEQKQHT